MTEPERAALDHIRRVVESVIGPAPATLPGGPNVLSVPYVSQLGAGADQFTNDSGAAAGVMLLRAYTDKTLTPNDFFNQTGQHADFPLSFTQILNVLAAGGVPTELRTSLKLSDLALILSSGRAPILLLKQDVLRVAGLTPETFNGPHYVVGVGMDMAQVYIHDPLRKDETGKAQGIPWLTFYRAWTQATGYARAALVPRTQLIRRVAVTAPSAVVRQQPNATAAQMGLARLGDVYEVTAQQAGWGKVGEGLWISLSTVADI